MSSIHCSTHKVIQYIQNFIVSLDDYRDGIVFW